VIVPALGPALTASLWHLQKQIEEVQRRNRRRATDGAVELDALRAQLHLSVSLQSQMLLLLVAKGVCTEEEMAPLRAALDALLETTEDKPFDWTGLDARS
jgi:hypothetical protein